MRISWRSSTPEEVTEIDADGNPVPSSLTPEQDMALRAAALGVCEYCGGPLTEIWSAGCGTTNVTFTTGIGTAVESSSFTGGEGATVTAYGGGGGGTWPPGESESWRFCSKAHMDAFLAQREP